MFTLHTFLNLSSILNHFFQTAKREIVYVYFMTLKKKLMYFYLENKFNCIKKNCIHLIRISQNKIFLVNILNPEN